MAEFEKIEEKKYKFFGYWKAPNIFQFLNHPFSYTLFYCIYATVTSCMVAGITVVNASDVEKRFDLTKADSAFIASGANIAFCVLVIFVSYFGEKWNKAKAITISCGIFGLGTFLYALPHFTTGLYEQAPDRFQLKCVPEWRPDCEVDKGLRYAMYIMFVGQFVMGAALTVFYTLGFTYLEQSVSQRSVSMYFGQIFVFINIGATVGILGTIGIKRNVYVDYDQSVTAGVETFDSRWVGAWWLFPLVCMAVGFIVMFMFVGYPKYLRGSSRFFHQRSVEIYDFGRNTNYSKELTFNIKGFFRGLSYLVRNPTFIFLTLVGCIQNLVLTGSSKFISKYYEQTLNMNAEDSGYTFGFLFALGTILGSFIGGIIIYVFNWKTSEIIKFCGYAMLLVAALSPSYLLHCDNIPIAGVTVKYGFQDDFTPPVTVNVTSPCNEHCLCQEENYIPVCGSDNITYVSPCHAACPVVAKPYTYGRCACVKDNINDGGLIGYQTVVDACGEHCHLKFYTLALTLCMVLLLGMVFSPILVATLRLVPNQLKSLSLGLQVFLFRCLGTIPSSELFDAVLAPACLLWQKDMCTGKQGVCNVYNNESMANNLMLLTLYGCLLAFLFAMAAVYFYKPVKMQQKELLTITNDDKCSVEESNDSFTDDDERKSEASTSTRL